ncbi:MAG: N-acetylmuramoyl-L-alanine amidase [Oscillospiraceae bacterium]|nr:N-acetylmuramoyl-L-alanine amidase [Oscillospiraceae bacterium]
MKIVSIPCRRENYGGLRAGTVEYLVVHYTAVPNDTAENEGAYFAREQVGASAHYFVDEKTIVSSVPEEYAAWHCGAASYRHDRCRNSNSIGVEICTKGTHGDYRFHPQALERARQLLRKLMERYQIPAERVLRHYDVTGKLCPAPFVGQGQAAWEEFKEGLTVYQTLEQLPAWARPTAEKLVQQGILQGTGEGLDLTQDMIRILVMLDRAAVFGKEQTNGNETQQRGSD